MVMMIYQKPLKEILSYMVLGVILYTFFRCLAAQMNIRLKKAVAWLNAALLLISLAAIFYITILTRTESETTLILRPFQSLEEARIQPEIYRSMLMNAFLFFPVGLFMPYALPEKIRHKAFLTVVLAMTCAIVIEAIQYEFRLGRCETDDVIMNTLGAALGSFSYLLYKQLKKCRRKRS